MSETNDDVQDGTGIERINDPADVILFINNRREQIKEKIKQCEPETSRESRLWGQYEGLGEVIDAFSELDDFDLPEWGVAVENVNTDEWEWYHPYAAKREDAVQKALDEAGDDLGDPLHVYEVSGPNAV